MARSRRRRESFDRDPTAKRRPCPVMVPPCRRTSLPIDGLVVRPEASVRRLASPRDPADEPRRLAPNSPIRGTRAAWMATLAVGMPAQVLCSAENTRRYWPLPAPSGSSSSRVPRRGRTHGAARRRGRTASRGRRPGGWPCRRSRRAVVAAAAGGAATTEHAPASTSASDRVADVEHRPVGLAHQVADAAATVDRGQQAPALAVDDELVDAEVLAQLDAAFERRDHGLDLAPLLEQAGQFVVRDVEVDRVGADPRRLFDAEAERAVVGTRNREAQVDEPDDERRRVVDPAHRPRSRAPRSSGRRSRRRRPTPARRRAKALRSCASARAGRATPAAPACRTFPEALAVPSCDKRLGDMHATGCGARARSWSRGQLRDVGTQTSAEARAARRPPA